MVKDVFSIKGTGTFSQHLPRGAVPLAARLWGHVFLQAPGTTGILARAQLWIVWASWHRGWGRGHRGLRPVSCPSGPGVECVHLSSWPPSPPVGWFLCVTKVISRASPAVCRLASGPCPLPPLQCPFVRAGAVLWLGLLGSSVPASLRSSIAACGPSFGAPQPFFF